MTDDERKALHLSKTPNEHVRRFVEATWGHRIKYAAPHLEDPCGPEPLVNMQSCQSHPGSIE
jgi:hypothetical protein